MAAYTEYHWGKIVAFSILTTYLIYRYIKVCIRNNREVLEKQKNRGNNNGCG